MRGGRGGLEPTKMYEKKKGKNDTVATENCNSTHPWVDRPATFYTLGGSFTVAFTVVARQDGPTGKKEVSND